jgi:hypothetical protein
MYAMFPHRGAPKVIIHRNRVGRRSRLAIVAGAPPESDRQPELCLALSHPQYQKTRERTDSHCMTTRCARALRPQSWGPTCSVDIPVGTCGGSASDESRALRRTDICVGADQDLGVREGVRHKLYLSATTGSLYASCALRHALIMRKVGG